MYIYVYIYIYVYTNWQESFPPSYFLSFLKQPRGSGPSEIQQKNRYLHLQQRLETGRPYLKNF